MRSSVNMAEENKPKGILKNSTSFDHDGPKDTAQAKKEREMKWDEMNILATYHPADKDYGHTKIDEPPTPYNKLTDEDIEHSGDDQEGDNIRSTEEVDPESLASRLAETGGQERVRTISSGTEEEEDENDEDHAKRKTFEQKRKMHYNEFHAVKLARQLLDDDDEEDVSAESKETAAKDESTAL